jgi:hypothetical protein
MEDKVNSIDNRLTRLEQLHMWGLSAVAITLLVILINKSKSGK